MPATITLDDELTYADKAEVLPVLAQAVEKPRLAIFRSEKNLRDGCGTQEQVNEAYLEHGPAIYRVLAIASRGMHMEQDWERYIAEHLAGQTVGFPKIRTDTLEQIMETRLVPIAPLRSKLVTHLVSNDHLTWRSLMKTSYEHMARFVRDGATDIGSRIDIREWYMDENTTREEAGWKTDQFRYHMGLKARGEAGGNTRLLWLSDYHRAAAVALSINADLREVGV